MMTLPSKGMASVLVCAAALLGAGMAQGAFAGPQQAPNNLAVITNQMQIPVLYQVLSVPGAAWQDGKVAAGNSIMVHPGCLRLSTGSPAVTKYYLLQQQGRYAFVANGHAIALMHNKDEEGPAKETDASDPQCTAAKP